MLTGEWTKIANDFICQKREGLYFMCAFVFFFPRVHDAWPQCISLFRSEVTEPRRWSFPALRLCWVFSVLSFVSFVHTHKKIINEFSNQDSGEGWCSLTLKKKNEGLYLMDAFGVFALWARCSTTMPPFFFTGVLGEVAAGLSFGGFSFVSFTLEIVKNTEFNANNSTQLCKIFVLRMGEVGHQNRKWQNFFMFIFYLFESHLK